MNAEGRRKGERVRPARGVWRPAKHILPFAIIPTLCAINPSPPTVYVLSAAAVAADAAMAGQTSQTDALGPIATKTHAGNLT